MTNSKAHEEFPYLYHYTRFSSFENIFETQCFWAKYFRDLNDSSEIFRIKTKLESLLIPGLKRIAKENRNELKKHIREFGNRRNFVKDQARVAMDAFFETTFGTDRKTGMFPVYITSFCNHTNDSEYVKNNGLLSMWRSYGDDGGVAIAIDTKMLEEHLNRESEEFLLSFGTLGDVCYENDDKSFIKEFGESIEIIKEKGIELLTNSNGFHSGENFIESFLNIATRYKHEAFQEEREVRIVTSPWTKDHLEAADKNQIKGRKYKNRFEQQNSRFIALFYGESVPRLPIVRVIVGPHAEQQKRLKQLSRLLKDREDIELVCSETPYLGSPPTFLGEQR